MSKLDRIKHIVKDTNEEISFNNIYKNTISDLNLTDIGRLFLLLEYLNVDNKIKHQNGKNIIASSLAKIIKVKNTRALNKYIREMIIKNILIKREDTLFINPLIARHNDFTWYREIFDLFEKDISLRLNDFEYLKLKSRWYDIIHTIVVNNIKDIKNNISGIYRLYKNNNIVYIGKSVCIKKRVNQHIKDKDIDCFDFTILDNESDKNIYEIYYIDKYKPILNKDGIENSISSISLKGLTFTKKIKTED